MNLICSILRFLSVLLLVFIFERKSISVLKKPYLIVVMKRSRVTLDQTKWLSEMVVEPANEGFLVFFFNPVFDNG